MYRILGGPLWFSVGQPTVAHPPLVVLWCTTATDTAGVQAPKLSTAESDLDVETWLQFFAVAVVMSQPLGETCQRV